MKSVIIAIVTMLLLSACGSTKVTTFAADVADGPKIAFGKYCVLPDALRYANRHFVQQYVLPDAKIDCSQYDLTLPKVVKFKAKVDKVLVKYCTRTKGWMRSTLRTVANLVIPAEQELAIPCDEILAAAEAVPD